MTLEEAQAEIIRLQGELDTVNTERDNYAARVGELENDLEKVRGINQEYFLRLSQQYKPTPEIDPDEGEDAPSCEDFAKTLIY